MPVTLGDYLVMRSNGVHPVLGLGCINGDPLQLAGLVPSRLVLTLHPLRCKAFSEKAVILVHGTNPLPTSTHSHLRALRWLFARPNRPGGFLNPYASGRGRSTVPGSMIRSEAPDAIHAAVRGLGWSLPLSTSARIYSRCSICACSPETRLCASLSI